MNSCLANYSVLSGKIRLKRFRIYLILALFILPFLLSSCSTVDCPSCREQQRSSSEKSVKPKWNVALNSKIIGKCSNEEILSVETDLKPVFRPFGQKQKEGNIDWDGKSFADYVKEKPVSQLSGVILVNTLCDNGSQQIYEIPTSNILEITEKADPLVPPRKWFPDEPCVCCCRDRKGLWFFDKVELRLMTGYRGMPDTIRYTQSNGTVNTYPPKIVNFDRGGSMLIFGFEAAGLWNLTQNRVFQLGFLTGVWPVDGSVFVPLALHGRVNSNQKPDPWGTKCDAWYIYGDLGLAFDFQTGAPIDEKRGFWGLGVGYDIPANCKVDFSIDIGFRQMKLPLPQIECCPDVEKQYRFPYRLSNAGILRFGLTF